MQFHKGELTIIPHESVGADCCGCIFPFIRGDEADLICNECETVIRTVPAAEVDRALAELARTVASPELCSYTCPHCGTLRVFPGFSSMIAFVCSECDQSVVIEPRVQ